MDLGRAKETIHLILLHFIIVIRFHSVLFIMQTGITRDYSIETI